MTPENIKPYDKEGAKSQQVEAMFDSIAHSYDFMNTAMTFGLHRRWRNKAIEMLSDALADSARFASASSPMKILDVATGTGDVAFRLYERFGPYAEITGIDLSNGMLDIARKKLAGMPDEERRHITFAKADCLHLPYSDGSFDAVTVAYGVRNFDRLAAGYAEILRVLRPGGILCVIELCEPASPLLRSGYRLYSHRLIPWIGKRISKDARAYTYLPESIAACPQRDDMTALMDTAGFNGSSWRTLFPGVIAIYIAAKAH